jgi:NAD(P)-dependent dehydrogenase (short-subunit alcohol dehydrogenase family)
MTSSGISADIDLSGQVALVTGGGRGLGQAYARGLAAVGASVGVLARTSEQLAETVELIEAAGGSAHAVSVDVADRLAIEDAVAEVEQRLGPIDILVNGAGINGPWKPTWETDPDEWWNTLEVNLRGPYLCSWTVLRSSMIARKSGRIIHISSAAAGGVPSVGAYSASKHALTVLAYCMAGETRSLGISVFAYFPGVVRTAMTEWDMTSPDVPEHLRRTFRAIFDEGRDDPIEHSAEQLVRVASGQLDALSGHYLHVRDDFDDMLRRVDEIRKDGLFMQRRVVPPAGGA